MRAALVVAQLLLACCAPESVQPARILGIFPHLGKSHFIMFEPLMKALAARGHDVIVVSHFPLKSPPTRYTDISLVGSITDAYVNSVPFGNFGEEDVEPTITLLSDMAVTACENVLPFPPVQKLLKSQEKFDLIIYELFNTDCFLGFIHKFNVPAIAISSSVFMPWSNERFGNPDNPSYIANHFLPHSDRMSFFQRLKNTFYLLGTNMMYKYYSLHSNKVARQHFGESLPPLEDIAANTSLLLINTHYSYSQVRPLVPAIVEVGGIHVQAPQKLPEDLEKFLSGAKHGVIYFSLGSTVRTATLPAEKRQALLDAFAELPQQVLWKWEDETLPNQPDNVKISKWLPQMSVLAHPNVKVFLNHGGLMGALEAIYNGVPMVSIPLFGDQYNNVQVLSDRGISVRLSYNNISKESVLATLRQVLDNPRYQENAKRTSRIYHDRPMSSMDTAVFWTEYVLRHRGARHLRSSAVDLPLYQYLLLDIVAFLVAAAVTLLGITYISLHWLLKLICLRRDGPRTQSPTRKTKRK